MSRRAPHLLVMFLLAALVLTGCGPTTSTPSSAPTSADNSDTLPADPTQTSGDARPIDESCPTSNTTSFAKTKFVFHAGLAFGAFHRYLYKPYQAGTFKKGTKGRVAAFVKGGLAALFIKREIRLAAEDVKANPTLCKAIAAPLGKLGDTINSAYDRLKSGDAGGITDANNAVSRIENTSKQDGVPIDEKDDADLTSTPT